MRIILLFVCCVCGNYGDNRNASQKRIVTFKASVIEDNWTKYGRCKTPSNELIVEEGTIVVLNVSGVHLPPKQIQNDEPQKSITSIQKITCSYTNGSEWYDFGQGFNIQEDDHWEEEITVTKHMFGTWSCKMEYNDQTRLGEILSVDKQRKYSYVLCNITVRKLDVSTASPVTTEEPGVTMNTKIWSIIGGVGILVLLIIVGQTIALCYFRRKAQPRRRMDVMTRRSRFDRGDRARYSAPPCKKGKSPARAQADTDSHIYEMVGVNALYNKSSDLNPDTNRDTVERNIRERPPLPLPHEIPKPVPAETLPRNKPSPMKSMPSTLSLNSTSSGCNLVGKKKGKELPPLPEPGFKKAPARPPKQIDEDSIPGSLRRPGMPTPAPAHAATPPVSAKIGSIPNAPSLESPMAELKNFFKKRNAGKDTPTSSPSATLERKENETPKLQAKPSTLTSQTQKQPKNVTAKPVKPTNQPNQIKLILPKIEASLRAPKPLVPNTIENTPPPSENTSSPIKVPPSKKSAQVVPAKPVPKKPVTQPAPKSVQNRPLPMPESARKLPPEPISPQTILSLTPRYKTSDEDLSHDTDEEEEWTYEQLGKYNIYNI